MYEPLRQAAAIVREALRTEAARELGVAAGTLTVKGGVFSTDDSKKTISYGELAARIKTVALPETPPELKEVEEFQIIGKSVPRVDLKGKILGKALYGYDVRLPGMLYGAVARPKQFGAKLVRAAEGDAASQPGVVKVVIDGDFAGIVAQTREQAYSALLNLDLEWKTDRIWQQEDIEKMVTAGNGDGVVIQRVGDSNNPLQGSKIISAEYRTPMAFHAHLEPQAATADVQQDKVEVWVSTQSPVSVRDAVAEELGRKPEEVVVHGMFMGGGFGRKVGTNQAVEAARLSAAVGKPVHTGWNRTEEIRNGFVRPPTHHRLQASLDTSGKVAGLINDQASGEVAFSFFPGFLQILMGADFAAWRGAIVPYDIPNCRTTAWVFEMPMWTGWWRGLGLMANVFAIESFMDEVAGVAGSDPIDFRLSHLPQTDHGKRQKRVLEAVRDHSGWGKSLPDGQGMGVAICSDVNTVVAQVAEVTVTGKTIKVNKVTAVVDPGLAINPDGVAAQTQGAITMGTSATLVEEAIVKDGQFTASNFTGYPLLTNRDAPDIDVVLLESGKTPYGMGEPPIGPIAAAIANAVYAATGTRLRKLPLRLE
jgi:isoquinoline 1-oxidoreductase beta subunit